MWYTIGIMSSLLAGFCFGCWCMDQHETSTHTFCNDRYHKMRDTLTKQIKDREQEIDRLIKGAA